MEPSAQQTEEIAAKLRQGRKIEAIKLYRAASGCGLKEAKDFIEHLETELRKQDPDSFEKQQPKGCGASAVIVAVFGLAVATVIGGLAAWVGGQ